MKSIFTLSDVVNNRVSIWLLQFVKGGDGKEQVVSKKVSFYFPRPMCLLSSKYDTWEFRCHHLSRDKVIWLQKYFSQNITDNPPDFDRKSMQARDFLEIIG